MLDPKTDNPAFGLANQPANNGNFVTGGLKTVDGGKDWHDLDLNESVPVQDKAGGVYRMLRVQ